MSEMLRNWKLCTELHKWLNAQVKPQRGHYEKGYNDAVLDLKLQMEKQIKNNLPEVVPIKLTST